MTSSAPHYSVVEGDYLYWVSAYNTAPPAPSSKTPIAALAVTKVGVMTAAGTSHS